MDELLKRLDKQNQREQRELSPEFLQTLAQELALTAETMNFELTDLAVAGYREALMDLRPDQLRRGFRRARRELNFFPKPNELRECARLEFEDELVISTPLPETPLSDEDKKVFYEEMAALGEKLAVKSKPVRQESMSVRQRSETNFVAMVGSQTLREWAASQYLGDDLPRSSQELLLIRTIQNYAKPRKTRAGPGKTRE